MHIKRMYLIIGLITIMAFITAWMQMQIVRQGYVITNLTKLKDQEINEQKKLKLQMTSLKSPQNLLISNKAKKDDLVIPEVMTLEEFNKRTSVTNKNVKEVATTNTRSK